jgi:hypothetical protein
MFPKITLVQRRGNVKVHTSSLSQRAQAYPIFGSKVENALEVALIIDRNPISLEAIASLCQFLDNREVCFIDTTLEGLRDLGTEVVIT